MTLPEDKYSNAPQWWRALRCFLGFHYRARGLVNITRYDWRSETLNYNSYLGCPHCKTEKSK